MATCVFRFPGPLGFRTPTPALVPLVLFLRTGVATYSQRQDTQDKNPEMGVRLT